MQRPAGTLSPPMSMFTRLFLLLGLLTGLSLAVVAAMLHRNSDRLERQLIARNKRVGDEVRSRGQMLVEETIRVTHTKIVREKARKLENFFAEVARAAELEASLAAHCLNDSGDVRNAPPLYSAVEVVRLRSTDADFRANQYDSRPYAMYHLAPGVSLESAWPQMNRLRRMGACFAHTRRTLLGCDSPYIGHEAGFIFGYPGGGSVFSPAYDPRQRPWYRNAMETKRLAWSIYLEKGTDTLIVTASVPIVPAGGAPVGVAAIDVRMPAVIDELFTVGDLKVSDAVLVDEQSRVRVSARYAPAGVQFNSEQMLKTPLASQLDEPGFARTLEQIEAGGQAESGVWWDNQDDNGGVFIYAAVTFLDTYGEDAPRINPEFPLVEPIRTPSANGSATAPAAQPAAAPASMPATGRTARRTPELAAAPSSKRWHYIVRLPKESINQPVVGVASHIDAATRDISTAIESGAAEANRTLFAIIVLALLAALTLAYFGARNTARPLVQMAGIARKIGQGNLDQHVAVRSRDEVGQLGEAINGMIVGLKQRNLLKDTFGQYVAPAVVNRVLSEGRAKLGGVKRNVTVFFSDLKGFTALSEQLPPEQLVLLLNEYFDAMTRVILATEGTLDKYVGDAIVAFWGEPVPHDDDPLRACRAALQQIQKLESLWPAWDARGLPRLDMRIGIQTGDAIVGNVGSDLKLNYTVLGDTANSASRLEGINKVYGTRILIGETTCQSARNGIEVREIDQITMLGKGEAVRVYELLGMAGEVPVERMKGYRAHQAALAAYRARRWDEAEASARQAISILGGDHASEVLIERLAAYRVTSPPEDWDGTYVAVSK
jgi:class 3 adenylate cyclase/HAMP domain-containing protein